MAGKLPAFLFYPKDWLADPVASCSLDAQGLWLRMMIVMHSSERYGYLRLNGAPMPPELVARRCGTPLDQYTTLLAELDLAGVPSRLEDGTIYSRRMVRDAKKRKDAQKFGRSGGNPKLGVNYNIPGYVYICRRTDGCIKIGISKHPEKRVSKIRSSENDFEIFLLSKVFVDDMGAVEATLHGEWEANKVEGEWFCLNDEQLKDLMASLTLKAKPKATFGNGNGDSLGSVKGNGVKGKGGGEPEFFDLIDKSLRRADFIEAWSDWLKHRAERKPPVKHTAAKQQLENCRKIGVERAIAAIRHSISNSYQGLFEPRNGHPATKEDARMSRVEKGFGDL